MLNALDFKAKSIPYAEARHRFPRKEKILVSTWVTWDKEAEKVAKKRVFSLATLGNVTLTIPPELPRGYAMCLHPEIQELVEKIYSKDKRVNSQYTPDYLDKVFEDLTLLREKGFSVYWEVVPRENHPEYFNKRSENNDLWDDFVCELHEAIDLYLESQDFDKSKPPLLDVAFDELKLVAKRRRLGN